MSLAQRAALRAQQPHAVHQPQRRRVYPIVILLVLLAAGVVAAAGFEYVYRDRVYPNVHVSGVAVNVGGQTQAAVIAQLYPYSVARLVRTVVLFAPGKAPVLVAAHQLGYHIDRGTTAWHAYNVGHGGSWLQRVKAQVNLLIHGAQVPVVQYVDRHALRHYLSATLAPLVNRKPRPGIAGRMLDVAAAQRSLASRLLSPAGTIRVHLPFIRIHALPRPKVVHHQNKQRAKKPHAARH
jgi:hypothetical protein